MSYIIKRCIVCNKEIHLHKRGSHYVLKDACEHIPSEKVEYCRDSDVGLLFKPYFQ